MKKLSVIIALFLVSSVFASEEISTARQTLEKITPETVALARRLAETYTVDGGLKQEMLFQVINDDMTGEKKEWREQMKDLKRGMWGITADEERLMGTEEQPWQNLMSIMVNLPLAIGIKKNLLWEMTAPDGSRHWIVAITHSSVNLNTLPQDAPLFDVVDKATIFMPEDFSTLSNIKKIAGTEEANVKIAVKILEGMFDNSLTIYGQSQGKRIVQLDEDPKLVASEAKVFSMIDNAERNKRLEGLSETEKIKLFLAYSNSTFKINQAFADGNLAEISKLMHERISSMFGTGSYMHRGTRNKRWVEVIKKTCKNKDGCLIYPGLSHVAEDKYSLISLLQENGFKLQQVK